MKADFQDLTARPKRYNNIDGTGEMGMGVMMLGFALIAYLQSILPAGWRGKHDPVGMLLLFGGMFAVLGLIKWGTKAIKKHITWPRTGYVAYRRDGKAWWTTYVVPAVGGAVIAAGFVFLMRQPHMMNLTRMVYLTIIVGSHAVFIYRFGREHPWKWLVLAFTALGLLVIGLVVPGDISEWGPPVLLFLGLVWLASGGATLFSYILRTQPPAPAAE